MWIGPVFVVLGSNAAAAVRVDGRYRILAYQFEILFVVCNRALHIDNHYVFVQKANVCTKNVKESYAAAA